MPAVRLLVGRQIVLFLLVIGLAITSACSKTEIVNGAPVSPTAPGVVVTALTLTCNATTLSVAGQTQCSAVAAMASGTPQDVTPTAQWNSSSAAASISSTGLVTAKTAGNVDIKATYGGFSATRTLVISSGAPTAQLRACMGLDWENGCDIGTAIQSATNVSFLSTSSGDGLTYRLAYGDGFTDFATSPQVFVHVYRSAGIFSALLTVTDKEGRTAVGAASVQVKNVTGSWSNTFRNPTNSRTENRILTLNQAGSTISGSYTHPEGNNEALTGTLADPRTISLRLTSGTIAFLTSDSLQCEFTPGTRGFASDLSTFSVHVCGGSADGFVLTFTKQ